jgi:hypothetical protein
VFWEDGGSRKMFHKFLGNTLALQGSLLNLSSVGLSSQLWRTKSIVARLKRKEYMGAYR